MANDGKKLRALTERQRSFVISYVTNGYNKLQAALNAGYTRSSALTGTAIIDNPNVKDHIQQAIAQQKRDEDFFKKLKVAYNDRLKVLSHIIYDIVDLDNPELSKRNMYKVAIAAVNELNKMAGDHAPNKLLSVTVDATKEKLKEARRVYDEY